MKKKTLLMTLILSLVISVFLASCEQKSSTPEQVSKALYDLYIVDKVDTENLPISEEEAKKIIEDSKSITKTSITADFQMDNIPDDIFEKLYSKIIDINKKLEVKTEVVSNEKDKAVVRITSSSIDEGAWDKGLDEKTSKLSEKELDDNNALLKVYENQLNETAQKPAFGEKPNSIDLVLIKNENKWEPLNDKEWEKFNQLGF